MGSSFIFQKLDSAAQLSLSWAETAGRLEHAAPAFMFSVLSDMAEQRSGHF